MFLLLVPVNTLFVLVQILASTVCALENRLLTLGDCCICHLLLAKITRWQYRWKHHYWQLLQMAVESSGCVQKQTEAAFDGTSSSYGDIQENLVLTWTASVTRISTSRWLDLLPGLFGWVQHLLVSPKLTKCSGSTESRSHAETMTGGSNKLRATEQTRWDLRIMWHNFYVMRWMEPWFRGIWQEVLELAGVDIGILMNVIGKWWFFSCVCEECCTKRAIKQISHPRSTLVPFCIQLIKQCSVNLAFLSADNSCMNFPK